ncbi:MAG: hypothetical protein J3R72DRAFT_460858, partial [Linnemannia gamsii]
MSFSSPLEGGQQKSPFGRQSSSQFVQRTPPIVQESASFKQHASFSGYSFSSKPSFGQPVHSFSQSSSFVSSANAPYIPTSTFDSTVYRTRKVQELTLSVKSRFAFIERTTTYSTNTTAQAHIDGPSSWFIKVSSPPPVTSGLFGNASSVSGTNTTASPISADTFGSTDTTSAEALVGSAGTRTTSDDDAPVPYFLGNTSTSTAGTTPARPLLGIFSTTTAGTASADDTIARPFLGNTSASTFSTKTAGGSLGSINTGILGTNTAGGFLGSSTTGAFGTNPAGGLVGSASSTSAGTTPAKATSTTSTPTTPSIKAGYIEVEVSWHNGQVFSKNKSTFSPTDLDIRQYESMTLIPKKNPSQFVTFPIAENALLDGKPIKGSIELNKVSTDNHAFEFDIVLSTATSVARIPQAPPSKNHDILPQFLKDPYSVDICFVFPNDLKAADVGVWAHRVVLSRSKVFAKMIDNAVQKGTTAAFSNAVAAAQQTEANQEDKDDDGKMSRSLSTHEDDTGSITSFTDIESQAYDSAGELSFSEPATPDLSKLECELGAVEVSIRNEDGSDDNQELPYSPKQEKQTEVTTEKNSNTSADTTASERKATLGIGAGPQTLTFAIENVSCVTFLSLLQYIYTGEINLSPNTQHFTFSSIEPNTRRSTYGNIKLNTDNSVSQQQQQDRETAQWGPFTGITPTSIFTDHLKYESLMLAADQYGIDDLATFCQQKVELSFGPHTVCRILFEVAPSYPAIKGPTLEYMTKSRSSIFTKDRDPFRDYRNHPECYNLMLEVVQLLASS